ncbi:hypothetical protein AWM75_03800 [Aerococcus urinaehominis]|uniref:Uncharacterized protein n=1 Tax=Aerococcus urinaehominis TaxID=128944 RepID=A0A0X8FKV6_9LACT|nr:neutral zinc metallopeptidase [Aerococcus urinaehominis]AMB99182.1 hypothetical protein AWM75_03800 [Aerococcus urinaehominis]SDM06606.1 hypothetical protein SAMN04487985_104119 [Aerococcus urinaehominis]
MRWQDRQRSRNVKDLRGSNPFGNGYRGTANQRRMRIPVPVPGTSRNRRVKRGGFSLGSILIMLVIFFLFGGGSLLGQITNSGTSQSPTSGQQAPNQSQVQLPATRPSQSSQEDELYDFVSVILYDTEQVWQRIFSANGRTYQEPELVVFSDAVNSGCGYANAQVGPFYCPADQTVYIDLDFYNDLVNKYGGGGDFAMAYVIAHEVGHHVQQQLGVTDQVRQLQSRMNQTQANQMTVRMELQADYLAGVWAHSAEQDGWLEAGDIEEGLNAAYHIGDDVLQEKAYGRVMPDSFTHGTAEQRQKWFLKGYQTGDLSGWDTFSQDYEDL